jgi:hypothetical protein
MSADLAPAPAVPVPALKIGVPFKLSVAANGKNYLITLSLALASDEMILTTSISTVVTNSDGAPVMNSGGAPLNP